MLSISKCSTSTPQCSLKIILSEHCGVFVEHLLIDSIYRKMVNIFIDLADEKTKDMFLYKLFEGNYSPQVKDNISKKFIIERLVGQISILQCQNRSDGKTITLPEPNYDKFPMFKIEVEDGTS